MSFGNTSLSKLDRRFQMTEKTLTITGRAANDYKSFKEGGTRRRKRYCKTRKEDRFDDEEVQEGGKRFNTPSGPSLARAENYTAATSLSHQVSLKGGAVLTQKDGVITPPQRGGAVPTTSGHTPQIPEKILADPQNPPAVGASLKERTAIIPHTIPTPNTNTPPSTLLGQSGGKLVLEPKRKQKGKLLLTPASGQSKRATRGHSQTRKIRIGFAGMKKRITRSKTIHRDAKEKSIDEIRKILEDAKLVKAAKEGKAVPEDILRNIYKDYMLLRGKAL